jgi:lysophospholipase L1-like esterase
VAKTPARGAAPISKENPSPVVGVVDDPCRVLPEAPEAVSAYIAAARAARAAGAPGPAPSARLMEAYQGWIRDRMALDFPDICRWARANRALAPAGPARVVFLGDSITEAWTEFDPGLFAGDRANRGVSGQTTVQMLGRFRSDVLELGPRVLHLMAGTNDIAGNTGPTTLDRIAGNVATMVELAQGRGVRVVLGATPPAGLFAWRPSLAPAGQIVALNDRLRAMAGAQALVWADYHSALAASDGSMRAGLSEDGVHPNAEGYRLMRPVAERAIAAALQSP